MINNVKNIPKKIFDIFNRKTVLNYFVIFFCSFMICCPPYFISYVPSYIKTPLRFVGIIFIFILYFFYVVYKQKISKLFVWTFIMCLYFFVICILNHNDYYYALYSNFLMPLSAIALFEIYSVGVLKRNFIKINYYFWLISCIIFVIYLIGQKYFVFMYNRNNFIIFYIIYILFERELMIIENKKKYRTISYLMSFLLILASIVSHAATTTIVLLFICLYIYILEKFDLYKKIFKNFYIYMLVLFLIFFLLIYPGSNSILADFISQLLHKEPGLSYRNLWYDIDRELILKKPIFGYGSTGDYSNLLGFGIKNNPHCFVFQYLIDGGVIGLMLLLNCYKLVINSIKRKQNVNIICFLLMILFAFTLRNLFEAIGLNYIMFILAETYFFFSISSKDYYDLTINFKMF